jgi:DNA-binding SARP family transcriptional activator
MLAFRLLGPLEVERDGAPLQLGGQKQRALLALLLLDARGVVSTSRLVQSLWGDEPPKRAMTSLQNFVSQLRKLLGPDVLVTRPAGYALQVAPGGLDLDEFRRLFDEARGAEPDERARFLRQALGLWRGEPLAEFAYDEWAAPEINRLTELRLAALEERVQADLEAGRAAEVVGELEALVAEHPLRERFREQLMLALYRSGRQVEALQAYRAARQTLVDELGVEPNPALRELHTAILRQDVRLSGPGTAPEPDHFAAVTAAMLAGRVVPVLGADVGDLAKRLARSFEYPGNGHPLTRVSQYVAVMRGSGPLYDELHSLLAEDVTPTPVHRFFASLAPLLRARGVPHQLLVTTSYDLALEQAFLDAGEEFDVVAYLATGRNRGKFCHLAPGGEPALIGIPNTYATELSLEQRTIILKLHGRVDPSPERQWESFVVTEDDYIDYLARTDVSAAVPVAVAAKLRRSHFLFLGYTMEDWNLRVVLNRLWGDRPLSYRSWAVQPEAKQLEQEFWRRRDVEVLQLPLDEYVSALGRAAEALA